MPKKSQDTCQDNPEKFPLKREVVLQQLKELEENGGVFHLSINRKGKNPRRVSLRWKRAWQWQIADLTDALNHALEHQDPHNHANSVIACLGAMAESFIERMQNLHAESHPTTSASKKKVWKKPSPPKTASPKK